MQENNDVAVNAMNEAPEQPAAEVVEQAAEGVTENQDVPEASVDAEQKESVKDGDGELPTHIKERLGRERKKALKLERENQRLRDQMLAFAASSQAQYPQQPEASILDLIPKGEPGSVKSEVVEALKSFDEAAKAERVRLSQAKAHEETRREWEKTFNDFQSQLDQASDTYEDFQDVVMANDVPITPSMRDNAMFLPNPADVLYHMAKDRTELNRIAQLSPASQAKEMVKLSADLMVKGRSNAVSVSKAPAPASNVKPSPVGSSSSNINNYSIDELRKVLR